MRQPAELLAATMETKVLVPPLAEIFRLVRETPAQPGIAARGLPQALCEAR
jgi:hypothetical protein